MVSCSVLQLKSQLFCIYKSSFWLLFFPRSCCLHNHKSFVMPEWSLHAGTRDDASDRAGNVEAPDPYTVQTYVYTQRCMIQCYMILPLGSLGTWDFAWRCWWCWIFFFFFNMQVYMIYDIHVISMSYHVIIIRYMSFDYSSTYEMRIFLHTHTYIHTYIYIYIYIYICNYIYINIFHTCLHFNSVHFICHSMTGTDARLNLVSGPPTEPSLELSMLWPPVITYSSFGSIINV